MEKQDKPFEVRQYGFAELAQLYSPHQSKKCAAAKLRNWIRVSTFLQHELSGAGYQSGNRILTPRQVGLIVQFVGEP